MIRGLSRPMARLRLALGLLAILVLALKLAVIPYPWPSLPPGECTYESRVECGFIFDEAHYVRAVRQIMISAPAGENHPNREHPPLAKLLMILGIMVFGDNPWGWRIPSALAGAASIYLLGLIAYELARNEKISVISAALFAFDITSFNLSNMAILDPAALAFTLLGALLYLRRRMIPAGIALGLALLSKLTAALAIAAILFTELAIISFRSDDFRSAMRGWLRCVEIMLLPALLVFIAGLGIYDHYYQVFPTPFMHLDFMLRYHSVMLSPNPSEGAPPLSWTNPIIQFPRRPYYVTSDHTIAYYGMQTPLWWMTWAVIGFSAYLLGMGLRRGELSIPDFFTLSWLACNYLVYFPIALLRPVYPFYFYSSVPLVAVGITRLLWGDRFTELTLYGLLAAQLAWFILFFPVKPSWLAAKLMELGLPI